MNFLDVEKKSLVPNSRVMKSLNFSFALLQPGNFNNAIKDSWFVFYSRQTGEKIVVRPIWKRERGGGGREKKMKWNRFELNAVPTSLEKNIHCVLYIQLYKNPKELFVHKLAAHDK